jgi:hydroxymethylglutaryl-CoA lyase
MGYPAVHLNEDTMREGMQIESVGISLKDKIRLIDALSATGIEQIEVGSFVSPRYTPQMAHVDEVVAGFTPCRGVRYTAAACNPWEQERRSAYMPPLALAPGVPTLSTHLCDTSSAATPTAPEPTSWPAGCMSSRRPSARAPPRAVSAWARPEG